ncbi:MAG TPA: hypothetical protein VFC19_21640 [Candidatus Limnocylindrales bacterium]|nr:hypothetical protein [Candidatus Limnocylindrales bacterium]
MNKKLKRLALPIIGALVVTFGGNGAGGRTSGAAVEQVRSP